MQENENWHAEKQQLKKDWLALRTNIDDGWEHFNLKGSKCGEKDKPIEWSILSIYDDKEFDELQVELDNTWMKFKGDCRKDWNEVKIELDEFWHDYSNKYIDWQNLKDSTAHAFKQLQKRSLRKLNNIK